MVVFKYPYLFNHMDLEGDYFCSQERRIIDFYQGGCVGATTAQEGETVIQN